MKTDKVRLDGLLVERGLFGSREKAQRAILAGEVFVSGQRSDKAGARFAADAAIEVTQKARYVSRGGQKLRRRAGSPIACCSMAPRACTPSTSVIPSSIGRSAAIRA